MTAPLSPNRDVLIRAAERLRPLLPELVFVGGQVAELLVTDPVAVRVRPTDDVDVITTAATRTAYAALSERLRVLGFREDAAEGAPLCRWVTADRVKLDVLPVDGEILGFNNRWYQDAVRSAHEFSLRSDLVILIPGTPSFLATKWDAFDDRGGEDYLGSADIEDIITVTAGRSSLLEECRASEPALRSWLAGRTGLFLRHRDAEDAIAGALPDSRLDATLIRRVRSTLEEIAEL